MYGFAVSTTLPFLVLPVIPAHSNVAEDPLESRSGSSFRYSFEYEE